MQRIKTIYAFILLTLISFAWIVNVNASNYYVSNLGDDAADGTSPGTSWETISKVNDQTFLPGDSVFFKAGDSWRQTLTIRQSGAKNNNIYFGRFGEGANPKFLGSEKAEDWTLTGTANIWQTSTELENYSDDYYGGRLFVMDDDTIIYADYKEYDAGFSNLTEEFDYTADGTTHYIYSTTDPDLAFDAIEINQRERVIEFAYFQSYLEINGIDILFGRRAGLHTGYPAPTGKGATDLIIRNCYVGYTGAPASGSAYGIACYHSNLLIENCIFSDNGRRSISINTYASGGHPGRVLENVIIRNNTFKRGYHTTSLDLSSMSVEGDVVNGVYFYNNYIDDSEFDEVGDWGGSNQLFIQAGINSSYMTNIYIVGNVFTYATWRNILLEGNRTFYIWYNTFAGHNPAITRSPWGNVGLGGADTIDWRNNILYDNLGANDLENYGLHGATDISYFSERDYNLYWQINAGNDRCFTSIKTEERNYFYNINQWAAYIAAFESFDQNSPLPSDPLFTDVDEFDFSLQQTSPARGAASPLPVVVVTDPFGEKDTLGVYDIAGIRRDPANPSIGAFEVLEIDSGAADIGRFSIAEQTAEAIIDKENHTVTIEVFYETDLTSLTPTIELSRGATIAPGSGVSQDFSEPFVYLVTSQNGLSEQNWTIHVLEQPYCNSISIALSAEIDADLNKGSSGAIDLTISGGISPYEYNWNNGDYDSEDISDLAAGEYSVLVTDDSSCTASATYLIQTIDTNIVDTILINLAPGYYQSDIGLNVTEDETTYYYGDVEIFCDVESTDLFNEYGHVPIEGWYYKIAETYALSENANVEVYITKLSDLYNYDVEVLCNLEGNTYNKYQYTVINGDSTMLDVYDETNCIVQRKDVLPVSDSIIVKAIPITDNTYINGIRIYVKNKVSVKVDKNIAAKPIEVSVFPNPTNSSFYVQTERQATIKIIDIAGVVVYEKYSTGKLTEIDSRFGSGIYFVQVMGDGFLSTAKLIIK